MYMDGGRPKFNYMIKRSRDYAVDWYYHVKTTKPVKLKEHDNKINYMYEPLPYKELDNLFRNVEYAEEKMRKNGYIAKTIYYWTKEEKNLYLYNFHQMNGNEWVGIGAGAYSYLEHSVIYNDLWEWKKHNWFTESNEEQIFRQNVTEQLIWDLSFEVKSGNFDVKILIQKYGEIAKPYLWKIVKRLKEKGYLQRKNNIICLSVKGKVLLDDVDKIIREVVLN